MEEPYAGPVAVDFVIHAASQASPKFYSTDPVGTFAANIIGTWRMLETARDARSEGFLFFSSGEVYGHLEDPLVPVSETSFGYLDPVNVRSCYAEGKRGGETLCACWHSQFGIPAKIIRLSHTYGPRMDLSDGRVFADFVADVVAGRNIVMKSDGSARRPFCYLADAIEGIFTVLLHGNGGEAYNVGSDSEISILELAELLCRLFPERKCRVVRQERNPDDPYLVSPALGGALRHRENKIDGMGADDRSGKDPKDRRELQRNLKGFITLSKYLLRGSQHEKTAAPRRESTPARITPATSPQGGD